MIEDPLFHWFALGLIFANGFVLGRAVFSTKIARHQRLSVALAPIAMTILFAPNVIQTSSQVRWASIWISVAVLATSMALSIWGALRPKALP